MDSKTVIQKLVRLSEQSCLEPNLSFYDLLKLTGYFKTADSISVKDICLELKKSPELIKEWIIYSENKRTSSGWYIEVKQSNKYIVGFLKMDGTDAYKEYDNCFKACAAFIKNELDSIVKA